MLQHGDVYHTQKHYHYIFFSSIYVVSITQPAHNPEVRAEIPPPVVWAEQDDGPTEENNGSVVVDDRTEKQPESDAEQGASDEAHQGADLSVGADGGHFNRNEDNQPSYGGAEEMQKIPPAVLEKPFDLGLSVEMEHSSGGRPVDPSGGVG